jgi:radical SAM superfamily enzyme YgiQ (UPF0313 family)
MSTTPADILLTTLNAKFIHTGFGLRYLMANLGPLRDRASLIEFDIHQRPVDVVEALLARRPRIVGLGVYIWNATPAAEVAATLKRVAPEVTLILGGPEVSYETENHPLIEWADHIITGEADLKFAEVCQAILDGHPPAARIIPAPPPNVETLVSPYAEYSAEDIANRVIYVEASRGCPFTCEFCLSSLEVPLRRFPLAPFLADMERLIERGVKHFKFVDRTFNLHLDTSRAILEFFAQRQAKHGLFAHFEIVPDRFPEALRNLVTRFPPGSIQFEAGIQTFNPQVSDNISRRQDYSRIEENVRFLRTQTHVHLHTDLIVGLPGESVESFGAGFDRLIAMGPQEIQVGILKRLRGAPIARHDQTWEMVYSPLPPYEILRNKLIPFDRMQRLRRFARYWDLVGNSGNFIETTPLIWSGEDSPFHAFLDWSDWLHARIGRQHSIALAGLAECLFEYLTKNRRLTPEDVAPRLWRDWQRAGRCEKPTFLGSYVTNEEVTQARERHFAAKRQARWA